MNDERIAAQLDALAGFYETLTPGSLGRLAELYCADAWFKDPFNEVTGLPGIERIFRHMFEQVEAPRFEVLERIRQGDQAMLGWLFSFGPPGRRIEVRGASHLRFAADGRVVRHRDYWDPAEELYAKLPLIGALMRWLQRRLSATR